MKAIFVATLQHVPIGAATLELAPSLGLLRSVAVASAQHHDGLGGQIVEHCLGLTRTHTLQTLYLMPNDDIAALFKRRGFSRIERRLVPQALRGLPSSRICAPKTTHA